MRKKGKRLEEGLKTLSGSKGKANRMRLQMTTRPSTSTSTSSDLQTPTLSDLQTPTLSDLQTPNDDEHVFNLNTPSNTNAVRSKQMKCLMKIFKSKFNQIFLSKFGFQCFVKLLWMVPVQLCRHDPGVHKRRHQGVEFECFFQPH